MLSYLLPEPVMSRDKVGCVHTYARNQDSGMLGWDRALSQERPHVSGSTPKSLPGSLPVSHSKRNPPSQQIVCRGGNRTFPLTHLNSLCRVSVINTNQREKHTNLFPVKLYVTWKPSVGNEEAVKPGVFMLGLMKSGELWRNSTGKALS